MKRHFPVLAILALLGSLGVAPVTAAAAPLRSIPTFAHPGLRAAEPEGEEVEAGEDEFEFEECEAGAEEFDFGEEEGLEEEEFEESCGGEEGGKAAAKGAAPFVTAPVACQVQRAESTITTLPGSDQVRLTVRYRTYDPTEVTVGLTLKDRKGSVAIEHTTKHMGPKGVLHITTRLGTAVMERALDASEFDVSLRVPESPGFCAGDLEQRLRSIKHTGGRAPRVYAD